jgi:hypothetical protein
MRLGLLTWADYTPLSNSDLDAAYAAAYAAGDVAAYTAMSSEIIGRQASLTGALRNLFGNMFPLYNAIQASLGRFDASTAAPLALETSAGNVVTTAENAVTTVVKALPSIGGTLILALASAAVIAWVWHFDKK